jgi:hypothetical protein
MLNHSSILKIQTKLLVNLIVVFSSYTGLFGADSGTIEFNTPSEIISPDLDATEIADVIADKIDQFSALILNEYQPGMSQQAIAGKLLCHIGILNHLLNDAAETLENHADRLMDNDPETKQLYQNIAAAIYAIKNSDKITDKEQALLTAKIINAINSSITKLLAKKSEIDLPTVEAHLKTYIANIHRDISTAKKRGASAKEITKLQAELATINQAADSLAKINKPLELLNWVQTAPYDPRAILARWYLGIQLAKKSSAF